MFVKGLPRNLGDPARLHECESKAEDRGTGAVPMRSRQQLLPAVSRRAVVRGTARANESERGGMDDGKSERLDGTDEAGEPKPAGSGRGKRGAGTRNC